MTRSLATLVILAAIVVAGAGVPKMLPAAVAGDEVAQVSATKQTLTLTVEKMTCALCPVTVRKAIEGVNGVKSVAVDFNKKTATVVFDPSVATPDQISAASRNAGYPATPAL